MLGSGWAHRVPRKAGTPRERVAVQAMNRDALHGPHNAVTCAVTMARQRRCQTTTVTAVTSPRGRPRAGLKENHGLYALSANRQSTPLFTLFSPPGAFS
jgi:hypothetical protein